MKIGSRPIARIARTGELTPPGRLGTADVEAFLNQLVGERQVAASTQNQALNALVFPYRHVLENAIAPDHLGKFELLRSSRPARLPTVLSADEVVLVLAAVPPARPASPAWLLVPSLTDGQLCQPERQPLLPYTARAGQEQDLWQPGTSQRPG